jgi:antitoxin VapB
VQGSFQKRLDGRVDADRLGHVIVHAGGEAGLIGRSCFREQAMYIDCVLINMEEDFMALQIANPDVVGKVERLAKRTGLSKTAAVERAVDRLLSETASPSRQAGRMGALLAQLDRIPDRSDASDPLEWDDQGLPK